jgi:hypothetical protein
LEAAEEENFLVFRMVGTVRRSGEAVAEFVPAVKVVGIFRTGNTRQKPCVEDS